MSGTTTIVYDYQVFWWQQYGGISRYFYELAKRVDSSDGFSASIIAPLHVNRYLGEGGVNVNGFRIPALSNTRRAVAFVNRHVSSALLKLANPNLVHETFFQERSQAQRDCPSVITVHDMIHEKYAGNSAVSHRITEQKRAAVRRADRVICISDSTRADLIELFDTDPAKIRTIHLGHALRRGESSTLAKPAKPFFLYVGMREGYKNFRHLLAAYASSQKLNSEFDLYAFGGGVFSPQEKNRIRAAGLHEEQVRHFSGGDALLSELYGNAVALVYPSLYEGFGIPPLEAMSAGCPVLCSNVSSIPEVVGDAGLYFDPTSIESIREIMERAGSSAAIRLGLIERGKKRVENFSYDRCAAETMGVYRELLR